jgi:hypothetical protein
MPSPFRSVNGKAWQAARRFATLLFFLIAEKLNSLYSYKTSVACRSRRKSSYDL